MVGHTLRESIRCCDPQQELAVGSAVGSRRLAVQSVIGGQQCGLASCKEKVLYGSIQLHQMLDLPN
eukprot:scaffold197171_cov35-Attheya_sp.AAC.1